MLNRLMLPFSRFETRGCEVGSFRLRKPARGLPGRAPTRPRSLLQKLQARRQTG